MPDLYDSDTSVNSDNEKEEPTEEPSDDEPTEAPEEPSDEEPPEAPSEPTEAPSDDEPSEPSDDETDDEMQPIDISDVIGNEDEFAELYKETSLNLFVAQLKPSLDETVRVMLGCKSKYVEIDVSTDMFGWAKQIKYPTEQFKTFVPAIPIQFVNMLATNAAQRVNDMETIYDGLKSSDIPLDTFTFLRQRKTDQTIESISPTINNIEFEASTPMLDLALQNPGYLTIIGDPTSKLKGAFNFLNSALVKPSKKQKIIRGKKEPIKTFNLRDIVYILSAAGAKKIVFYNVSNSFTVEDNEAEELSEQADLGEPDEVSLDMSGLEPKEEEDEEDEAEEAEEASVAGEEAEEASVAGEEAEEASAIGETSNAGEGVVDASVAVEEASGEAKEAVEAVVPVNSEESEISSVDKATAGSEFNSSIVGGSMFDGKLGGKYSRRARERRLKTSRKLSLIHKRHRYI